MCEKKRCRWAAGSEEMIRYHDQEWGTPQHDDAKLFELFFLGDCAEKAGSVPPRTGRF